MDSISSERKSKYHILVSLDHELLKLSVMGSDVKEMDICRPKMTQAVSMWTMARS